MLRALAIMLVLSVVVAGPALGQGFGVAPPKPKDGKDQKDDKDDQAAKDRKKDATDEKAEPTALEKLVRELEVLVAREKAKPEYDADLVKVLEDLVRKFEKEVAKEKRAAAKRKKVSLDDLSEEDRKQLEDEMRKRLAEEWRQRWGGGPGGGAGGGDWTQRAIDRALEGVELKDDQTEKATEILKDYYAEARTAAGDAKLLKDLRNDTEKRLRKAVGRTKAKKIMNNLNRMAGGRRGWGR